MHYLALRNRSMQHLKLSLPVTRLLRRVPGHAMQRITR
jgi:hypothetical protein